MPQIKTHHINNILKHSKLDVSFDSRDLRVCKAGITQYTCNFVVAAGYRQCHFQVTGKFLVICVGCYIMQS